jgi:hypothetical protein
MKAGDALVKTAKYAEAKAKYLEAAKIDAERTEPAAAIAKIEKLIADQAEAEKNKKITDYNTAMKAGEDLVTANKLAEAKLKYQEAQKIDASQTKPAENIAKIDKLIADQAEAAKSKEKADKYNAAMKSGDDLMASNKLPEAKVKYQEAQKIDASQTKPAENIAKIEKLLLNQVEAQKAKEKADKITALLKEGSTLFGKNDLENAKIKYQDVFALDQTNAEATSKINDINAKIAAKNSEAEKIEKFKTLKTKGLDLMRQEKWSEAKQILLEAKTYKESSEFNILSKLINCVVQTPPSDKQLS